MMMMMIMILMYSRSAILLGWLLRQNSFEGSSLNLFPFAIAIVSKLVTFTMVLDFNSVGVTSLNVFGREFFLMIAFDHTF